MKLWFNRLMAPTEDGDMGGGNDIFDDADTPDNDIDDDDDLDDDLDDDDDDLGNEDEPVPKQRGRGPSIDLDKLPDLIAQSAARLNQAQQRPQQMSPEDRDKALKRYKVTKDDVAELLESGDVEKQIGALQRLLDASAEHALTSSGYLARHLVSQLEGSVQPMQQFLVTQRVKEFHDGVTQKFPSLKGRPRVIERAIQQVQQSGSTQFASRNAAFKAVAREAQKIIREVDPNFSVKKSSQSGPARFPRRTGGGGGQQRQNQSEAWPGQSIFH